MPRPTNLNPVKMERVLLTSFKYKGYAILIKYNYDSKTSKIEINGNELEVPLVDKLTVENIAKAMINGVDNKWKYSDTQS